MIEVRRELQSSETGRKVVCSNHITYMVTLYYYTTAGKNTETREYSHASSIY